MKKTGWSLLIFFSLLACNQQESKPPQTALDTGREFIRASLDGNFEKAASYVLEDVQNEQLFDSYIVFYNKLPDAVKSGYKKAAYEINKYSDLNDSTSIINYSNSYMNEPMEIKLVRSNKKWAVDFKYTYSGNTP